MYLTVGDPKACELGWGWDDGGIKKSECVCIFVLLGPSMHWMMSTHIGEGRFSLLSLLYIC